MEFFRKIINNINYPYVVHIPNIPYNECKIFYSSEDLTNYLNISKDKDKYWVRLDLIYIRYVYEYI